MTVRPMASPEPFRVWTVSVFPVAVLYLIFALLAWKSTKLLHDDISL